MSEPFLSASWYRVAASRPRLRPHGQVRAHRYSGRTWYVIDDRASGRVHRFTSATYLFLSRMDGHKSLEQIWDEVASQLGEDSPTQDELLRLLTKLHAADLLELEGAPDVGELIERLKKKRRQWLSALVKSPVSVRVPLFDPDRILHRLADAIGAVPAWFWLMLWLVLVIPAAMLVPIHWQELTNNFTDQLLSYQNIFVLALLYPMIKLFHELGHGVIARYYGGEVHETGFMLLVFYPIPYVDASSSLALRSKYKRALVGAGGVIVEVAIAAVAFYIWIAVEPGLIRAIAFNAIVIAGVSSLFVNGNPLLKYDGYFVLSDLVEIPNLASRSAKYLGYLVEYYLFGAKDREFDLEPRERIWFILYAPASFIYRIMVSIGIAMFVAVEYLAVGVALGIWLLFGALVLPIVKGLRHLLVSPSLRRYRVRVVSWVIGVLVVAAMALFLAPAPHHISAEGVLWIPEDGQVRAGASGFVSRLLVTPGSVVHVGQSLIESEDPLLEAKARVQKFKVEELEIQLKSELVLDRAKAAITTKQLEEEEAELTRLEDKLEDLVSVSEGEGILVVPNDRDLAGRYVAEGELLAYVVPAEAGLTRVVVPQEDAELVRRDLVGVEAVVAGQLSAPLRGTVVREVPGGRSEIPSKVLTTEGGGRFIIDTRERDRLLALSRVFQFDISLSPPPKEALYGSRVYVKFEFPPEPIGLQLYRRVRQVFLSYFDV